jgi:hypothetical protein
MFPKLVVGSLCSVSPVELVGVVFGSIVVILWEWGNERRL